MMKVIVCGVKGGGRKKKKVSVRKPAAGFEGGWEGRSDGLRARQRPFVY
jgi:hypothetical protein